MSSSEEREERAPLVYSLHVDNSAEDPLAQRSSSVTNGATNILSRIPTNLNPPWRALAGIFGLLVIATVVVLIMYFFTTALVPAAFPIPRAISKRSVDFCDFGNELESDVGLWNNLLPFETQEKFVKDQRRIFFVKRQGDNLTEANVCALKSAGRESRVFLIVLVPEMTMRDALVAVDEIKEAGLDREVEVMVADPARYFGDTPLAGYDDDDGSWRRDLKIFALKVVTVWRFGGAAYDLDLVTLERSHKIEPRSVALEPSPKIEPWAPPNENAVLELSSSIEPPQVTLKPSPGTTPRTEAIKLSINIEPWSVTMGPSPEIESETVTLNHTIKIEPRPVTFGPSAATLNLTPEIEPKNALDYKATLKNSSTMEPRSVTLNPSTELEPGTMTLSHSSGIEPKAMPLNDSTGVEPKAAALKASSKANPWAETLKSSTRIEPQIVALNHSPGIEPRPPADGNATVSLDGAILIAHQPCHAFVFAVMRELMEVDLTRREDATVSMAVQRGLTSFCGPDLGSCKGVKVVPKDRICVGDAVEDGQCQWARVGAGDSEWAWNKHCAR